MIFRQLSDPQDRWIDPGHASQVHAGRGRIVVLPAWRESVLLRLDPGRAFGTGAHPSTALVLEVLPAIPLAGATVQDRSNGRLILGIGTGPAVRGALDRLRATVAMLRDAFAGETATTPEGEPFQLALVPASPPPIWVAALGPRAMHLAGAVGDGVLLNWCTPERVARARVELAEGAAAVGRDPAEVSVGVYVRACVHAEAAQRCDQKGAEWTEPLRPAAGYGEPPGCFLSGFVLSGFILSVPGWLSPPPAGWSGSSRAARLDTATSSVNSCN